jgi:hypothetical protein
VQIQPFVRINPRINKNQILSTSPEIANLNQS